jgi:hypothetical protein
MNRQLARGLALAGLALLVACGERPAGLPPEDAGPGSPDGGGTQAQACSSAAQCPPAEVCDLASGRCAAEVACQGHEACGAGAHCASTSRCARSTTGSPCASNLNCAAGTCTGGFCGCEGQAYTAERVPPNVLIVLDRSSSMNQSLGSGQTRWTVARSAIADLLAQAGDGVRFGLALYPGTNVSCSQGANCAAGAVFVPPGENTATQINSVLSSANRCSFGTPTAAMMASLHGHAALADASRANYVLLVTDGQSTCNNEPTDEVAALRAQNPEVKTFVVGFVDGAPAELNAMATAGGTAIPGGPPYYYDAQSATQLSQAFSAIAGSVFSCTYTLSSTPLDLSDLYVYQDQVAIPRDTQRASGWDYEAATNQLTFYGSSCEALKSGAVTDLVIVYGCPLQIG